MLLICMDVITGDCIGCRVLFFARSENVREVEIGRRLKAAIDGLMDLRRQRRVREVERFVRRERRGCSILEPVLCCNGGGGGLNEQ